MNEWVRSFVLILIFFLLVLGIYKLFRSITMLNMARNNMKRIYSKLHEQDEIRVEQLELERRMYGTTSRRTDGKLGFVSKFLQKVDDVLIYSEMSIRHPWLNTSTYLVLSILCGSFIILTGVALKGQLIINILVACVIVAVPYIYMLILCDINYIKTEKQLLFFLNMVAGNSMVTNNIVTVFEDTVKYTNEPVKGAINRALAYSKLAAKEEDIVMAFINRLTREVEHPLFVRFIQHLEICSGGDADYRSVARDFSVHVKSHIDKQESLRAAFKNIRNMILAIFAVGILVWRTTCVDMGVTFMQVIEALLKTPLGIAVMAFVCIAFGITAIYVLIGSRR